jgi:hypothetical protein
MDYGKILSRAWEITWRWKVLWILGFLAALGRGGSPGNANYTTDSSDWAGYSYPGYEFPPEIIFLILGLICLGLLIGIALWVISIISRGGLIAGVQQVEDENATTFGQAWRVGASRFWTLFGISILAALPLIILVVAGIIAFVVAIVGGVAVSDFSEGGSVAIILPTMLCGGVFCCGMIILGIILGQIRLYAERAAVLEGMGWIQAFGRGWEVLKENLGPTIIFWIIFFVIGLALAMLIFVIVLVLFLPFIAVMASADSGLWLIVPGCCGGAIAIIVAALIGAIVEVFSSATWTLAYREMTGLSAVPTEAAQLVVEPVAE